MADEIQEHPAEISARRLGRLRRYIVPCLLFAAFVLLVQHYSGWARLLAPWAGLPLVQLVSAVALILSSYAIRTLRLFSYFRMRGTRDLALCLKVMLQHNLFNNLLPMRSGELAFPLLLRRHFALPLVRSLPALLWFRLLDMHTLVSLGIIALGQDYLHGARLWILLVVWNLVPYLLFRGWGALGTRLESSAGRHDGLAVRVLNALPGEAYAFWTSWGWSVLNWAVKLGAYAWILQLFVEASARVALLGAVGGELTSVLPIHSIAGMGTYESGVVAGLLPFGIGLEQALAGAVNLHLVFLAATLTGGIASLFIRGGDKRSVPV